MIDLNLRTAYGKTLVELGKINEQIVLVEADLCKSTMGILFEEAFPERFFEMGIAEADMAAVAAGLSLTGKIPFIASFAAFAPGRCYDQIRTSICIPGLNVKICGSSAGLSDFGDGATHQSIDDISLMRVLPGMCVFSPVDAIQTAQIVRYMAENKGPMYIRINRNDLPVLTSDEQQFKPGKIYTMREGGDIAIFATGIMVSIAMETVKILSEKGIDSKVLNVPTIKPVNPDDVLSICKEAKAIVTAEEHSIYGGLGDAISTVVAPKIAIKHVRVGIQDSFGTSAQNYKVLLEHYGLVPETIVQAAVNAKRN